MTFEELQSICSRITYKEGWMLSTARIYDDVWHLWVVFETTDSTDGKLVSLESRVWLIDPTFSEDAVIHTAFLAIKQTEEHEMMEFFRVDGVGIFNPHITVDAQKRAYRATFET